MASFERAARSLKVVPIIAPVHSDAEIETSIIALGREPRGGLVVMPDAFVVAHRVPIILAAARNNVPAVYALSQSVKDGGSEKPKRNGKRWYGNNRTVLVGNPEYANGGMFDGTSEL